MCMINNTISCGRCGSILLQLLFFVYFSQRAHLYTGGALIRAELETGKHTTENRIFRFLIVFYDFYH